MQEDTDNYSIALRHQSLKYLAHAETMVNAFLSDFKQSLVKVISYATFKDIVTKLCLSSNQLRMAITKTE